MPDKKDKTDNPLRQVLIVAGLFFFSILLIAHSALPAKADNLTFIEKVRVGLHPDTVRIVLTLDRRPGRPSLSGTTTARPSVSLVGVMPGAGVHRSLVVRTASFRKYLSAINISYEPSDRTTRLSLRFVHPVPPPKVFILSSPHRIVMDFAISDGRNPGKVKKSSTGKRSRRIVIPGKALPSAQVPSYEPPSPHSAPSGSAPSVEKSRPPLMAAGFPTSARPFRVVLDAGHGGRDCGTTSLSGICEKTLVLDIVKRLRRILDRDPRFQVILTRADDRFVSLPDRTRIANESHGDLFLSVHANADPDPGVRGLETFLLNLHSSDARAQRIAQRENSALGVSRGDLSAILLTLKIN
ncbi:MAG: N-acetylmuramoyl-L-alanine amidase, partial [Nitrospiraceae bacterium]|nr:N-acetylmuramoyl-L-alanine amidase [Nitrospiraceae bacterium]